MSRAKGLYAAAGCCQREGIDQTRPGTKMMPPTAALILNQDLYPSTRCLTDPLVCRAFAMVTGSAADSLFHLVYYGLYFFESEMSKHHEENGTVQTGED